MNHAPPTIKHVRLIQSVFNSITTESGGGPLLRAATAAPTGYRAQGPRQTEPEPTNVRSLTAPPPPGNKGRRRASENGSNPTMTEPPQLQQNPTQVRTGDGEILIAVMGAAGSGKSYFCRAATGGNDIGARGSRPGSHTREPTRHQLTLRNADGEMLVTLLDIPGFHDSNSNNTAIPREKAVGLRDTYAQGRKFSGILYFHRISDTHAEDSAITDTNPRVFHELCGDDSGMLKNVILATTHWDLVEKEVGIQRQTDLENNPRYWKPICLHGSQVRSFKGTRESALDLIRLVMNNTPRPLKIQQGVVDENEPLPKTGAGRSVEPEIDNLRKENEQSSSAIMEIELALQEKEDMQAQLKKESERSKKEIDGLREQQEMMKADNKEVLALLREVLERHRKESDRSQKEIDRLHEQQKVMEADIKKVLTLLSKEPELRISSSETPTTLTSVTTPGVCDENGSNAVTGEDLHATSEQLLQLLSAAPRALCSIGQCFAIAWPDGANNIVHEGDPELSKFRTDLVECSDRGREAFREAEDRMGQVSFIIQNITEPRGVIEKILGCLKEENPSTQALSELFGDLERFANECIKDSKLVAEKTREWKQLVSKMNEAYSTTDGILYSVNSVGEAKMTISPKGKGNSMAEESKNQFGPRAALVPKFTKFFRKQEIWATEASPQQRAKANERIKKQQQDEQRRSDRDVGELQDMASKDAATREHVSGILRNCQQNMEELDRGAERLHKFFGMLHDFARPITKQDLRTCVTKLYVYYTIAGDTSSAFADISHRYIMPGIKRLDNLSSTKTQRGDIEEVVRGIAQRSKEAQQEIHDLVEERWRGLEKKLFDTERAEEIS